MKVIHAAIRIKATPRQVWELLTDFASYPQWNPLIRRADGSPKTGERIELSLQPPGAGTIVYRPEVLKSEPEYELRWRGRLLSGWVCESEHIFRIEPLSPDEVKFSQIEIFKGVLRPLFLSSLEKPLQKGFELMNITLKVWAERSAFQFFYC